MSRGVPRGVRATVFAVAGTALGVGAHRFGGGMRPDDLAVVVALLGLVVVGYGFAGRERGVRALITLVVGTQVALHLGFAAFGMPGMSSTQTMDGMDRSARGTVLCFAGGRPPTAADLMAARQTLRHMGLAAPDVAAHGAGLLMHESLLMLVGHLLAAVVLGWWLAQGERVAWRCARRVVESICAVVHGFAVATRNSDSGVVGGEAKSPAASFGYLSAPGRAPPTRRYCVLHAATA